MSQAGEDSKLGIDYDVSTIRGNAEKWTIVGGTALGAQHERNGQPCQDTVAWWVGAADSTAHIRAVGVVADGAGSARAAQLGSQTAAAEVIHLVKCLVGLAHPANDEDRAWLAASAPASGWGDDQGVPVLVRSDDARQEQAAAGSDAANGDGRSGGGEITGGTDPSAKSDDAHSRGSPSPLSEAELSNAERVAVRIMKSLFDGARRRVGIVSRTGQFDLRDLATTLMVVLVTKDAVVVGQVGDGVAAVRLSTGDVLGPVHPQRGEFANETTFITSGEAVKEICIASFPAPNVNAFGLSSDGMRLLITSDVIAGTPHVPFFNDVFDSVAGGLSSNEVSRYLREVDDRTGDDKSLVIGVRIP